MNATRCSIRAALLLAATAALAPAALAQSDWAPCADEGAACRVDRPALVRFGADGRYAFRVVNQRVMCDVDEFGDPLPRVRKRCEVSYAWRSDERYRGWREPGGAGDGWRLCANEGELCRVPGTARVRYGAAGRYAQREVSGAVDCNNAVFGDPAPEIAKQCEYAVDDGGGRPRGSGALAWDGCAAEGERCDVRGAAIVRYGQAGRFLYREVDRGIDCRNRAFGGDPAPGQTKRCETLRMGR